MKRIMLVIAVLFVTVSTKGQQFKKGTTAVNAGIGLGTALGGLGKARPAVSASVDRGMWDVGGPGVVSVGGYLGNTGYKYSDGGYDAKWNYFIVGARGAYHYNGFSSLSKLDVYGGVMLGYNIVSYTADGDEISTGNSYGSGVGFSGFVGGRWLFSENVGAYAELGYGVSVLNVGVTFLF